MPSLCFYPLYIFAKIKFMNRENVFNLMKENLKNQNLTKHFLMIEIENDKNFESRLKNN